MRRPSDKHSISVVVPVYNAVDTLDDLAELLADELPSLSDAYELILVNDGSHDQSWQAIERLSQTYTWIRGLDLMRNYGQHNALLCGIREARNEIVVTIDDDMQQTTLI